MVWYGMADGRTDRQTDEKVSEGCGDGGREKERRRDDSRRRDPHLHGRCTQLTTAHLTSDKEFPLGN